MNDAETLVILNKIKAFQGSMGLHRADILNHLLSMLIPLEYANACLETLIDKGFIKESSMTKLYSLTPKAILWMSNSNFDKNRMEYLKIAHKIANDIPEKTSLPNPAKEKSTFRKRVEFWSWVIVILGTIIGSYFAIIDHLPKHP